jgi:hypothetical protein
MNKTQYLTCPHCDGHGAFSHDSNDPYGKSWACSVCDGTGERPNGARKWDYALAVFIKAFSQAEGDREERCEIAYDAVAEFDAELAEHLCDDAEEYLRSQRLAAIEADCNRLDAAVRQVSSAPASWAALDVVVRGV